jgi:hypothetical protein
MSQLKYSVCIACEKGILTHVAEVGIDAEGDVRKFQSLSAANGRIYKCDNCGKSFIKIDDKFLEL